MWYEGEPPLNCGIYLFGGICKNPQNLQALLTPITALVAILAVCIAYQQHRLQKVMAKYALYEKRAAVFRGVTDFIESVRIGDDSDSEEGRKSRREALARFNNTTAENIFIFKDDIQEYIRELCSKESQVHTADRRLNSPSFNNEERPALESERGELYDWFAEQQLRAIEKFKPYLAIDIPIKIRQKTLYHAYHALGDKRKGS